MGLENFKQKVNSKDNDGKRTIKELKSIEINI